MSKHFLKFAHVNIRSLIPSFDHVINVINQYSLDVVGISETWLSKQVTNDNLSIPGFNLYRVDRVGRGGGVALYVKSNLNVTLIDVGLMGTELEQLWMAIKIKHITYAFGVVYRPPKSNVSDALSILESSVSLVLPKVDEILVMGDLNINLLKPGSAVDLFDDFLQSFNFQQLVVLPTRCNGLNESLLDVILLSNRDLLVGDVIHHDMHGSSDHQMTEGTLAIEVPFQTPKFIRYRDFRCFDKELFNSDLQRLNWNELYNIPDIDTKLNTLTNIIQSIFQHHAPLREIRVTKPKSPWFTDVLRIMKKERNVLLSKYKKSKRLEDWEAYKGVRNLFTMAVRNEKKKHI